MQCPHMHVNDLPNEVLLLFFAPSNLKTLIALRGVSTRWRHLISVAHIHPARRGLLEFYLRVINSPVFLPTRPHILQWLQNFNRQAFINSLPVSTPEDFKIWILEWPARAAIGWIWPGLRGRPSSEPPDIAMSTRGMNVLGYAAAPYTNRFTLIDPAIAQEMWHLGSPPIPRPWTSNIWSKLDVNTVFVRTLFVCWSDPCFASDEWVQYVVEVGEGGEELLGNVRHFDMGDLGCIAMSWIGFLEHELEFEEWDYAGGR